MRQHGSLALSQANSITCSRARTQRVERYESEAFEPSPYVAVSGCTPPLLPFDRTLRGLIQRTCGLHGSSRCPRSQAERVVRSLCKAPTDGAQSADTQEKDSA
eukprot:3399145-Pleurochrysis_carterae.AAC.3